MIRSTRMRPVSWVRRDRSNATRRACSSFRANQVGRHDCAAAADLPQDAPASFNPVRSSIRFSSGSPLNIRRDVFSMLSESSVTSLNARPLMRIEKLTLEFPAQSRSASALRALDDVSLDIAAGEIIGLVGESGSGKTTLRKTLLGMYPARSGHIWYEGIDVATADTAALRPRRRDLQMVFQDPLSSFNPRFRIGDSIALPLRLH